MKPYLKYWPIALVCLLVVTNPSPTAFKNYLGRTSYNGLKREMNFFVCSVYRYGDTYLGLFGNFVDVTWHERTAYNEPRGVEVKRDSSALVKELPYKERVYMALKDNLSDFSVSKEQFYQKIKDRSYDLKVYKALKENLSGFNKTPEQFVLLINK